MASSPTSKPECVLLPHISPLIDRRKVEPGNAYEHIAETLQKSGFAAGWSNGGLQVSSATHSGSATAAGTPAGPAGRGLRPRTSAFLSFNRTKDTAPRPRTSSSFSGLSSTHSGPSSQPQPQSQPPHPRHPRERFSRLATPALESASSSPAALALPHSDSHPSTTTFYAHGAASQAHAHASPQRLPSRGGPPSASAASPPGPLPRSAAVAASLGVSNAPSQNLRDADRPATGKLGTHGHGSWRGREGGPLVVTVPLGSGPAPGSPQAQAAGFRPSRGHVLNVFHDLDSDKNGKVTRSELEAAALSLGFSLEQAGRLWDRLDKRKRGFLEPPDWGTPDAAPQISLFSTRYMQKYLGLPDMSATAEQARKYWRAQELMQVKSLGAAINMARTNAVARGMQAAGATGNPVFDTFRFMDADGSGELSRTELRDAFFALGVNISDGVVDNIMQVFDKDGGGTVQYHEFAATMFPQSRNG